MVKNKTIKNNSSPVPPHHHHHPTKARGMIILLKPAQNINQFRVQIKFIARNAIGSN